MDTSLIFNEQGQATGLWVGWLFDDYYSAFTLEVIQRQEDGSYDQKALNRLAEENLRNLSEYSYFTFIKVDGKQTPYLPVTDYKTHVSQNRLWMEFTVMFKDAIDPKKHAIDYAVYDPTFYVEILHEAKGDPIQFIGTGARGCGYALKRPEPPEEISLMAGMLDKDETAGDGIGQYFAERVVISCP